MVRSDSLGWAGDTGCGEQGGRGRGPLGFCRVGGVPSLRAGQRDIQPVRWVVETEGVPETQRSPDIELEGHCSQPLLWQVGRPRTGAVCAQR